MAYIFFCVFPKLLTCWKLDFVLINLKKKIHKHYIIFSFSSSLKHLDKEPPKIYCQIFWFLAYMY